MNQESPLSRKALLNALHAQALEYPQGLPAFVLEDYRKWTPKRLFDSLKQKGWVLDRPSFVAYADSCESPEELLDLLCAEEEMDNDEEDELFLVIFELWRRFAGRGQSPEIICDELDYQIQSYDEGEQVDDKIEAALSHLVQFIQHETQTESEAKELFSLLNQMCAQDLEIFLFDFITDQAKAGAFQYAKELHARFNDWISRPLWWDFIVVHWEGNDEASGLLTQLLKQLSRQSDRELVFEILSYLSEHEIPGLFEPFLQLALRMPLEQEEREELTSFIETYSSHHEGPNEWKLGLLDLLKQRVSLSKNS
jgi:hypothetical protein